MSAKKRTKTPKPSQRAEASSGRGAGTERADPVRADSAAANAVRVSPRASGRKRKASSDPRPQQLESVFSPVEIDFFERAADMYAEEYDVWEDFRHAEAN